MVPESSAVSQIRTNLKDRYSSGYPILKELLQNADDAESARFLLDARHGWPGAKNPLLREPGLLVANDGNFDAKDRVALQSLGKSYKAEDRATIGKFGLGQTAVYHLCDAFVVHAVGVDQPFSIVLNPFFEDERTHGVTSLWETIDAKDTDWLTREAGEYFQERGLVLWLPLRSKKLRPKPRAGFFDIPYDSEAIIDDFAREDDLRVLLTLLRHLERVEICLEGKTRCLVELAAVSNRRRGPHSVPCTSSFHGKFDTTADWSSDSTYVGREATADDCRLTKFRSNRRWPKVTLDDKEVDEAGEQHGAATLLRAVSKEAHPNELKISWAVFLPTETEDQVPLSRRMGRIHLLLHGYFFLDSGRRHVVWLSDSTEQAEPATYGELCRSWNTRLRNEVVLPLVPCLLVDALDRGVVTATEFPFLVEDLANSTWFRGPARGVAAVRGAVCRDYSLVRVLDLAADPAIVAWRLVPKGRQLRPLPANWAEHPERVSLLFDGIAEWARKQNITLCIDASASLTATPMQWTDDEINSLFSGLSSRAFQRNELAVLLSDLLSEVATSAHDIVGPHLVNAFRAAMISPENLAGQNHRTILLGFVPRHLLFTVTLGREVLRALAKLDTKCLAVNSELPNTDNPKPSLVDLLLFLPALEEFIKGEHQARADEAYVAALALLDGHQIGNLGDEFHNVSVIRARDPMKNRTILLSFDELIARSQQWSLLRRPPGIDSQLIDDRLRILARALPRFEPLIVAAPQGHIVHGLTHPADNNTFGDVVSGARQFGDDTHRAALIRILRPFGSKHYATLRNLCAGRHLGEGMVTLWNAGKLPGEIADVVISIVSNSGRDRLVPQLIAGALSLDEMTALNIKQGGIIGALRDRLCAEPWLPIGGSISVAPMQVLDLTPSVHDAVTELELDLDYTPLYQIPQKIRNRDDFRYAHQHLISDRCSSIEKLALMIGQLRPSGVLGAHETYPFESFAELAEEDLGPAGCRLLAAMLSDIRHDDGLVRVVVGAFRQLSEDEWEDAARHLDALAGLAVEGGPRGEAAKSAYNHGFKAVAEWHAAKRHSVFRNARVPTRNQSWRYGSQVAAEGDGIPAEYMLKKEYAKVLPLDHPAPDPREGDGDEAGHHEVDFEQLRKLSNEQHRGFLSVFRGRIPSDLAALYLSMVTRHNPLLEDVRKELLLEATLTGIRTDIAELMQEIRRVLVLVQESESEVVWILAISGDYFQAPLEEGALDIVIGNRHHLIKRRYERAVGRLEIITFDVRTSGMEELPVSELVRRFRLFAEILADMVFPDDARKRFCRVLERVAEVGQATLEDTERQLRDVLPRLIAELRVPKESTAYHALERFYDKAHRTDDLDAIKRELWRDIGTAQAAKELLWAVRKKIHTHGYRPSRILFELFQNADDAYVQCDYCTETPRFRVDLSDSGMRIFHWGRTINRLGDDRSNGRDLFNMLAMGVSEKHGEETGKFGLGFKCIHLLSDSVGIVSGFIALRTIGGLLPKQWTHDMQLNRVSTSGQKVTVLDVPYTGTTHRRAASHAERAFVRAVIWLPAFALRITRIEVGSMAVDCATEELARGLHTVTVTVNREDKHRALRIDLEHDYRLLLRIGTEGPVCFESTVKRLWNLAPLEEELSSGWLLNGPFPVDHGRIRLAGEADDQRQQFEILGCALGDRFVQLYGVVEQHWSQLVDRFYLPVCAESKWRFWRGLLEVMARDADDRIARCLHLDGRGYGRLVAECPVVPCSLGQLVRVSDVQGVAAGALADLGLEAIQTWHSAEQMTSRIVDGDVADSLRRMGFNIPRITLSAILRKEIGDDKRVDVDTAARIGHVIRPSDLENDPLFQERREILEEAGKSRFLAQNESWEHVSRLISNQGNYDEKLMYDFAPNDALIHRDYADALGFFKVARMQSGYRPRVEILGAWVVSAAKDDQKKRAVLRYLASGLHGSRLASHLLRNELPNWLDEVKRNFATHMLLSGLSREQRNTLLIRLYPDSRLTPPCPPSRLCPKPKSVLKNLYDWWKVRRLGESKLYAERVYPYPFDHRLLQREPIDREAWFTMLALACYQSFGRAQDEQHREFIAQGLDDGWWQILSSQPQDELAPWRDLLERWSDSELKNQERHRWRRTLLDLFIIDRGLDVYVKLIREFPRFLAARGRTSLRAILCPQVSLLAQDLGLNAAPIERTLGIGTNWLIRELLRYGYYRGSDAAQLAPYCWTSSDRVRRFLRTLGLSLDLNADADVSPTVYGFLEKHLGQDVTFFGDYDLPLQIVTRMSHRYRLNGWLLDAGFSPFDE